MNTNTLISQITSALVLGFGVSGKAAARYLNRLGAKVYISDARHHGDLSAAEKDFLIEVSEAYETGGHTLQFLDNADAVFISPGIPEKMNVVREAEKRNIPVMGELALAAPVLDVPVVGVSGTNGKTTVTTLIGHLIKGSGRSVFVGGNIGRPVLEFLMDNEKAETAVVEISSFQLERAGGFRPDIAVLLNITPDHLDRHGSLAEYIRAKKKLFVNQKPDDLAIICTDNLICRELADHMEYRPLTFGHSKECDAYICESEIYVRFQQKIEIYDLSSTVFNNLIGSLNCAAAVLASRHCGCSREDIIRGLAAFQQLPHRMEFVAEIDGVWFYNDSKATNTGAVISALQQSRGKVVLIAGGREKGEDYSLMRTAVKNKVRKLIVIGEAAGSLSADLSDLADTASAGTMQEAVEMANKAALPGDTVLLSPACASFDMFDSYEHRGQIFKDSVKRLCLSVAAENQG